MTFLCAQNRDAIVFSKIGVLDPGHVHAGKGVLPVPLLDGFAAISHDDHEFFDAGPMRAAHHVLEKGFPIQVYERLGPLARSGSNAASVPRSENQS